MSRSTKNVKSNPEDQHLTGSPPPRVNVLKPFIVASPKTQNSNSQVHGPRASKKNSCPLSQHSFACLVPSIWTVSVTQLTVRLLVARTGGGPAELLRFTSAGVGHQKVAVVRHEELLYLALRGLVHVLLVEGDDGLSDGLADSVDLKSDGDSVGGKERG